MHFSLKVFDNINDYGIVNGLKLYFAHKYKKEVSITFPFLKHPVFFRYLLTRSDTLMFHQVFVRKDYAIPVPFEPTFILDLGVNVGFASLYFANRFPGANIIGLEPNKENYYMACKNTRDYKNVQIIHGAIWSSTEKVFILDKGFGEASFMVSDKSELGDETIPAFSIPDLLSQYNMAAADIIKIDIEGSEKEIFEHGFEAWIPKTKIIIVETHDRYKKGSGKAVLETMSKYDFSLEISGENLVFYNNILANPYR